MHSILCLCFILFLSSACAKYPITAVTECSPLEYKQNLGQSSLSFDCRIFPEYNYDFPTTFPFLEGRYKYLIYIPKPSIRYDYLEYEYETVICWMKYEEVEYIEAKQYCLTHFSLDLQYKQYFGDAEFTRTVSDPDRGNAEKILFGFSDREKTLFFLGHLVNKLDENNNDMYGFSIINFDFDRYLRTFFNDAYDWNRLK